MASSGGVHAGRGALPPCLLHPVPNRSSLPGPSSHPPSCLPAPQLLEGVCKEGVRAVESQQAAAAALSAAVAAAGTLMIRAGIF